MKLKTCLNFVYLLNLELTSFLEIWEYHIPKDVLHSILQTKKYLLEARKNLESKINNDKVLVKKLYQGGHHE